MTGSFCSWLWIIPGDGRAEKIIIIIKYTGIDA